MSRLPEGLSTRPLTPDDVHPVADLLAAAEPVDGARRSWAHCRAPEQ